MRTWLAEIARVTGGELHGPAGDIEVTRVSTDTRTIESGDCFVALRGERLDGHDYLDQAVARGAATLAGSWRAGRPYPAVRHRGALRTRR